VRATAAGFCYHQGAIWGWLAGPLLGTWAATAGGFAVPMLVTTIASLIVFVIALLAGPETKGRDPAGWRRRRLTDSEALAGFDFPFLEKLLGPGQLAPRGMPHASTADRCLRSAGKTLLLLGSDGPSQFIRRLLIE